MASQDELKKWIESNCPLFWSLLNIKAKTSLPKGLIEYIGTGTPSEIETGRNNLETPEKVPCIRAVDGFLANITAKGLI